MRLPSPCVTKRSATATQFPSSPLPLLKLAQKGKSCVRQYQSPTPNTNTLKFSINTTTGEKRTTTSDAFGDVTLAPDLIPKKNQSLTQETNCSLPCRPKLTFPIEDRQDERLQQLLFSQICNAQEQEAANSDWEAFNCMSVQYQNKITALVRAIKIDDPHVFDASEDDNEIIPKRNTNDRLYKGDQKREAILQLAHLLRAIGWSWNGIAKVTGMSHTNLRQWIQADKKPPTHYAYEIENDHEFFTIMLTNPRLSSWTHPARIYLMKLLNKSNLSPNQFLKKHCQYLASVKKSALYNWKKDDATNRPEFWTKYYPKRPPREQAVIEKIRNDEELFRVVNKRKKFFPQAVKEYIVLQRRASRLPVHLFLDSAIGKKYQPIVRKSALYEWEKEI